MSEDGERMAVLSCWGYGYEVKVLVNGNDVGVKGGKSESKRLFGKDSAMAKEAPPEMRKQLFVFEKGQNTLAVEFKKTSKETTDYLQVSLEMEGYPAPVVLMNSRLKPSGKVEQKFSFEGFSPQAFKPVLITDQGEGKSVLVYVGSEGATVTPVLNGEKGMTLGGMSGSVVLENVKPGKNELAVTYKGEPKEELQFSVVTPEGAKFITRVLQDGAEKTETFPFTAK